MDELIACTKCTWAEAWTVCAPSFRHLKATKAGWPSAWDSLPPFGAAGAHVTPHVAQKDCGRRWKCWRGQMDEGPRVAVGYWLACLWV